MTRISKKCPKCKKLYEIEFEMGEFVKVSKDFNSAEKELALKIEECQCK